MRYRLTPLGKALLILLLAGLSYGVTALSRQQHVQTAPPFPEPLMAPQSAPLRATDATPPETPQPMSAAEPLAEGSSSSPHAGATQHAALTDVPPASTPEMPSSSHVRSGTGISPAACAPHLAGLRLSLYHAPHSPDHDKSLQPRLDSLARQVQAIPGLHLKIEGNCAIMPGQQVSEQERSYYARLSQDRAKRVADYLVSRGVPMTSLDIHGNGANKPLTDNSSPQNRFLNRRTDIVAILARQHHPLK